MAVDPQVRADLQELEHRIKDVAGAVYELSDAVQQLAQKSGEGFIASLASSAQSKAGRHR